MSKSTLVFNTSSLFNKLNTIPQEIAAELEALGFQPRAIDKLKDDYGHLMVEEGDILKIEE